jgi:hypothetical protein
MTYDWHNHPCIALNRLTETAGTKFNLPTLTRAMGFSGWEAQLMSAPPYVS